MSRARGRLRRTGAPPGVRETIRLLRTAIAEHRAAQPRRILSTPARLSATREYRPPAVVDPYKAWLDVNRWTPRAEADLRRRLNAAGAQGLRLPSISVVMPVYDPPIRFLALAIRSVISQVYGDWELCVADDNSRDPAVRACLQQYAADEPRIKIVHRETNGNVSRTTNDAASLAGGEFLLFLDHDDELSPDCLGEMALYASRHPMVDFIYSDDDKIGIDGERFAPRFKPGWSPELLLSYMYLGHVCMVRHSLFEALGGFRVGFEGSQDYDFALRATERARRVGHVPLVLYHWRTVPGSTAVSGDAKSSAIDAGRRSVQEALDRRGRKATVDQPEWAHAAGAGVYAHEFPDDGPSVAIVIPTRNNARLLRSAVNSLSRTSYRNFRIVIVDNENDDPRALAYLRALEESGGTILRIAAPSRQEGPSSFAHLSNEAVKRLSEHFVLFLSDEVEILEQRWLSRMVGYSLLDGVGVVGARLEFPDGGIQHAGIVHGLHHGLVGHAFKLLPPGGNGYLSHAAISGNYSAVTAACLLTTRELFLRMGGFDDRLFARAYSDVDYCYRLAVEGYRCVYAAGARLVHHKDTSRDCEHIPESANFRRKYDTWTDPFFNPNLSLDDELFQIRPRRLSPRDVTLLPSARRVMLFTNALEFTGAPLHQCEIAVNLKQAGEFEPVACCHAGGPLSEWYEAAGVRVLISEVEHEALIGDRGGERQRVAVEKLGAWLRHQEVDVVYANTLETSFAVQAARYAGIPSIWNIHESEPWREYFPRFSPDVATSALRAFEHPYRVVFVADATRTLFEDLNTRHNFSVVYNSLDTGRLDRLLAGRTREGVRDALGVDGDELMILQLGTVCERKGQLELVEALRGLPISWHARVRVFIVGDRVCPYSDELHAALRTLPETFAMRVAVVPATPDIAKFLAAADVFVCTSRVESFPRVTLEAMYFGLPIVSTPVFGIREQIVPGTNGLLYEPGCPDELLQALVGLLEDPIKRRYQGEQGRHMLRRLNSFDAMCGAYREMLLEAVASEPWRA